MPNGGNGVFFALRWWRDVCWITWVTLPTLSYNSGVREGYPGGPWWTQWIPNFNQPSDSDSIKLLGERKFDDILLMVYIGWYIVFCPWDLLVWYTYPHLVEFLFFSCGQIWVKKVDP